MSAQIIDGKKIASEVNEDNRKEISMLARDCNLQPGLAVVPGRRRPGITSLC